MGDLDERIFNDDLLANAGDHKVARELYPAVEHVLYHQELIDYFKKYNDRADLAKKTSRTWGKRAIALGATAIALAAIEIIVEITAPSPWPLVLGAVAAICGVSSVAIGAFGVLFGSRKREWLHNRFMGERIRQFHFQSFIAQLPQIAASLEGDGHAAAKAKAEFESNRRKLFLQFKNKLERNLDSQFTSVVGPYGEADWWLHDSEQTISLASYRRELEPLFAAYRHLRIKHQLGFANFKLQSDHRIFSAMPVRQVEILENISKAGIAWLLLIHVSVLVIVLSAFGILVLGVPLVSAIGDATSVISIVFSVAIIVIAVVALSARAFQQGLQPEREIERYQQYRSAVQSILEQFDEADTPSQKIRVMRQMERLTFDEMRNFVRTYDRSSFAM
jgi:membrane protein implicated in regulation of membrane protease activity